MRMPDKKRKIIIEADRIEPDEKQTRKKTMRILSFLLAGENYSVDIRQAREITKVSYVTGVPNTPSFIIGVMDLRGEIISLIDIRNLLGLTEKLRIEKAAVIVTDIAGSLVGIVIDEIGETLDIEEESIQPPLATIDSKVAEYTKGQVQLKGEILSLLDLGKILKCEEIENLRKGEGPCR